MLRHDLSHMHASFFLLHDLLGGCTVDLFKESLVKRVPFIYARNQQTPTTASKTFKLLVNYWDERQLRFCVIYAFHSLSSAMNKFILDVFLTADRWPAWSAITAGRLAKLSLVISLVICVLVAWWIYSVNTTQTK